MKKIIPFVLLIFSIFGILLFIRVELGDKQSLVNLNKSDSNLKLQEFFTYFVVLTDFQDPLSDISFEKLKNQSIATDKSSGEDVSNMLKLKDITLFENDADIYEWIKSNSFNGMVVVPYTKATPFLKTLRVDGKLIWDKGIDLNDYPLKYRWQVLASPGEIDKTENFDNKKLLTYVAGGEVIPARAVARKFRSTGDYTFAFRNVQTLFTEADFSSVLLENSINGTPTPCHGCVSFIGDEAFTQGLKYIDVDVLSEAGNHALDGGVNSIKRTGEVLDEAGIAHTGASHISQDLASQPAIVERDGFKIAFLGYDDVAAYAWAGPTWGGAARISYKAADGTKQIDLEKIKSDIARAKEMSDFVIVIMSWGDREYVNYAADNQVNLAHALIDNGADLIIGSHQHWVNEVEFYKGKQIFYGIGNFVFDQTHTDPTRESVLLKFYFYDKKIVYSEIIPIQSCGPQQSSVDNESCDWFTPVILEETDPVYKTIMERMWQFSNI